MRACLSTGASLKPVMAFLPEGFHAILDLIPFSRDFLSVTKHTFFTWSKLLKMTFCVCNLQHFQCLLKNILNLTIVASLSQECPIQSRQQ